MVTKFKRLRFEVYVITNKLNGKQYVGQTTRGVHTRFVEHCGKYESHMIVTQAILKYGPSNFTCESIAEASDYEELNKLETEYIQKFNTLAPNGYNMTEGGVNGPRSLATRERMKISNKRPHTETTKLKLREINLGKKLSEDTRRKIGDSLRGKKRKPFTEEHRLNIGKSSKGRTFTPESLSKISEGVSGSKNGMYGKKHSEEFKKAMSLKQKSLKTPRTKLTSKNVVTIRKLLSEGKSITSIAKTYNVVFETIKDIKLGNTWKHVVEESDSVGEVQATTI